MKTSTNIQQIIIEIIGFMRLQQLLFYLPVLSLCVNNHNLKTKKKLQHPYIFDAGFCSIPHPDKAYKGGEDAQYISKDGLILAVADGVGGWNKRGVDPAFYARALMRGMELAQQYATNVDSAVSVMLSGYTHARAQEGSSTCCVVALVGLTISSANLGDSGFMIIREGGILHRSKPQQHSFNRPYALGSNSTKTPEHADKQKIRAVPGDIVILASDGLWDNLFDEQVLEIAHHNSNNPTKLAKDIAWRASLIANDKTAITPFVEAYKAIGGKRIGGKLDDITVVVGIVKDVSSEGTQKNVSNNGGWFSKLF